MIHSTYSADSTTGTAIVQRIVVLDTTGTHGAHDEMLQLLDRIEHAFLVPDFDRIIELLPAPLRLYVYPPVRQWHRCRAQILGGRSPCMRLPRGRVRAWRSLKEKRRAWGIA